MTDTTGAPRRSAAKAAGIAYLFMVLGGIHYYLFVGSRLTVAGNATATANTVLANEALFRVGVGYELLMAINLVVLAMALYVILEPIRRSLASLALYLVLAEAILAAAMVLVAFFALQLLRGQSSLTSLGPERLLDLVGLYLSVRMAGHTISTVFLCLGMLVFMFLLLGSRLVPGVLAGFGVVSYSLMLLAALINILIPGSPASMMSLQSTFDLVCIVPSILFEVCAGLWLSFRGVDLGADARGLVS
jgi:Domain of unknown function (DUF4386)